MAAGSIVAGSMVRQDIMVEGKMEQDCSLKDKETDRNVRVRYSPQGHIHVDLHPPTRPYHPTS
jgi:hypothetical protein